MKDKIERKITETNKYLIRYGADYNLGIKRAWQFFLLKILTFAAVYLLGLKITNSAVALAAGILGFFAPNMLVQKMNDMDNDEMFGDLKAIYDTLRIQQSAGVYITNALMDCYLMVRNKRLKTAMKELSRNIVSEKDISKALNILSEKFRNDYIDELVVSVNQSVQTGQITKILEEINKQMLHIEENINIKKEKSVERTMTMIEILLYVGILGIALYGLAVSASTSIYNF